MMDGDASVNTGDSKLDVVIPVSQRLLSTTSEGTSDVVVELDKDLADSNSVSKSSPFWHLTCPA